PPHLHMQLAEVQRANGRLAEAEESYRQALTVLGTASKNVIIVGPANYYEGVALSGRARCLLAAGRSGQGEGLYRQALRVCPKGREVRIGWAWFLATRPDADRRNPGRAIELTKPFTGGPNGTFFSVIIALGVAQYRAGDWKAAAASLERVV